MFREFLINNSTRFGYYGMCFIRSTIQIMLFSATPLDSVRNWCWVEVALNKVWLCVVRLFGRGLNASNDLYLLSSLSVFFHQSDAEMFYHVYCEVSISDKLTFPYYIVFNRFHLFTKWKHRVYSLKTTTLVIKYCKKHY